MAIETVLRYSFPSNHLITAQLVKEPANNDSFKPLYFFMIALIPGAKGESGRTYDFKSGTHIKYGLHEVIGLSFGLKQYAGGNFNHMNYVKFTQSKNVTKSVSLMADHETKSSGNKEITTRYIHLRFSSGGNTNSVKLTCDQAFSMGEILQKMADIGINNELSREVGADSFKQQNNSSANNNPAPFEPDNDIPSQDTGGFNNFGNNPFG